MITIEERAIEKYPITAENADKAIAMRKIYVQIATEQEAIDDAELHQRFEKVLNGQKWYLIETIPQLYVRWLMIEGEKPSWKEYAIKTMEEQIWE